MLCHAAGCPARSTFEAHSLEPLKVLRLAQILGGHPERMIVVGCEPATVEADENGDIALSAPVQASLDEAVRLVTSLVQELRA